MASSDEKDMSLFVWGDNKDGRLGLGDERNRHGPTLLNHVANSSWIEVACGDHHTVALCRNGEVYTWGNGTFGQLGHGDNYSTNIPTRVESLLCGVTVIKVKCGEYHTAVITKEGVLLTWGRGYYGQLGHGSKDDELLPKKVTELANELIIDVACGGNHTAALTSKGSIYTWGNNSCGRTGHVSTHRTPRLLRKLSNKIVICISANGYHTACVTQEGEVFTFGSGRYGKLGHGDEVSHHTPKMIDSLEGVKVKQLSCGHYHTALCTEEGKVYTFGEGDSGKLGHGDKEDRYLPELVQALKNYIITKVQCGKDHSMALTSCGYVFTWGGNGLNGKLGLCYDSLESLSLPHVVEELLEHKASHIASFGEHSTVLVDSSPCPVRRSRRGLLNNEEHSDVVFMVENEPIHANTDILCEKSEYFQAMFRSKMRESLERVVEMSSCSRVTFLLFLEYIYTCALPKMIITEQLVDLFYLADMYFVEGLKFYCMAALERDLNDGNHREVLEQIECFGDSCIDLKSFLFGH